MEIKLVTDKSVYQELWQRQQGHFLQSWQWGELRQGAGWLVKRLVISDHFVVTIMTRRLPLRGQIGYIPRLTLPRATNRAGLLSEIVSYADRELHLGMLIIDPNWSSGEFALGSEFRLQQQIQPQYTNILELTGKGVTEVWEGMKGSYRRNIKKAARQDVSVEIYRRPEELLAVKDLYQVLNEIAGTTDYLLTNEHYFQRLWRLFAGDELARIYVARVNQKLAGAYLVTFDADGAYEIYGGVTALGRNFEAGYALKWEALKDAVALGKGFYDHWGVAPRLEESGYDPTHPLARISEFKAGFGGRYVEFEQQLIIPFNQVSYWYYQLLGQGKQLLLQIKKRLKR